MSYRLKSSIEYLRIFFIEFIFAIAIFIVSVTFFAVIANEIVIEKEDQFDENVFAFLASYASPLMTKTALVVTFFGSLYFLLPGNLLIAYYFFRNKNKIYAILVCTIALISSFSGLLLKELFQRARPPLPLISGAAGYSFPSGHSLAGFTFGGVIIYLIWKSPWKRQAKWILCVFVSLFGLLIGLSRIYLRVHFASDVLGSLFITIVWLSISFISLQRIEKRLRYNYKS